METAPLIASAFDPSGQLFTSAVPSLDLHKVQVHSVSGDSTNSLQAEVTLDKGFTVQTLTWGKTSGNKAGKQQRKKRKRSMNGSENVGSNVDEDLVVIIGTNKGSVMLFSPFQSSVVSTLSGAHSVPVTCVASQSIDSTTLWSCDHSGLIGKWNLTNKSNAGKPFKTSEQDIRLIQPISSEQYPDHLLTASTGIHLIDPSKPSKTLVSYPGFVHPVTSILQTNTNSDLFIAYSKSERTVTVNSLAQNKNVSVLTAQSNVQAAVLEDDDSACAVVTEDGTVEVFLNPLTPKSSSSSSANRRRSAQMASKSVAQFKVVRPDKSGVNISNVVFSDDYLTITWLENATVPVFEKVAWKNATGVNELVKARKTMTTSDHLVNGVDPAAPKTYNEAQAHVTSGKDTANLEEDASDSEDEEQDESTLAERLDALDVDKNEQAGATGTGTSSLSMSTPGTFTTLLTQALKTNDHSLLETCLANREDNMIKLSVQRLDSQLAVKLIERIAEKIARQPTQAGQLNVWIKWVMIAHGGYLVTLPNLLKTLSSLHATLTDRVSTLPRLLALQGRLEMLSSQMELRRDLARKNEQDDDELEDEDETEVTYVEDGAYIANGEEDSDADSDEEEDEEDSGSDSETEANGFIDDEAEEGMSDMEVDGSMHQESDDEESETEQVTTPKKRLNGKPKRK